MIGKLIDSADDVRRRAGSYARSRRRLRRIFEANPDAARHEPSPDVRAGVDRLWPDRFRRSLALAWCKVYATASGIEDHRYVPGFMFSHDVAGRLNDERLAHAYTDKNAYDRWFPGAPLPEVVLRRIHGRFYDRAYRPVSDVGRVLAEHVGRDLVVKPSIESGGGSNVYVGRLSDEGFEHEPRPLPHEELFARYGPNFVVQHRLEQHAVLRSLHAESLNTLRVLTLRLHDDVRVVSTVLRMGGHGARVDNQASGGLSCGVRSDGELNPFGVDAVGRRLERHPSTGTAFAGLRLPGVGLVHELLTRLHGDLPHFDVVSWDAAVGPDGEALLIEFNLLAQGIVLHQLNNGPLFGDATEDVLRHAAAR